MMQIHIKDHLDKAADGFVHVVIDANEKAADVKEALGDKLHQAKVDADRRRFRPIFDKTTLNFSKPEMIRIISSNDSRRQCEACLDAYAFDTQVKGMRILDVCEDSIERLELNLIPSRNEEIYYVDPYIANTYIGLDDYFTHLKKARVAELENIAYDLGATHVKITFKEIKQTLIRKKEKAAVKVQDAKADFHHQHEDKDYASIRVAAEAKFSEGREPHIPNLVYFKDDADINSLIRMRIGSNAGKLASKTYSIAYDSKHGIKEDVALKIDAALKQLKCNGNTSVVSEVQNQTRMILEYKIDF